MKHDTHLTASAKAVLAAGQHLQRKDAGDPFEMLAKNLAAHTDTVLERISKTDSELKSLRQEVDDVDKRLSRPGGFRETKAQTWGEQFVNDAGLKSFAADESRPGRFRINVKATMTNALDSGGSLHTPARDATLILPKRRMTVRDLLPTISVGSDAVEYAAQTTRTNNAATVPEGSTKPESAYAFELRSTQTRVIAHWLPASRQVLSDSAQLRDLIDSELRHGLMLEEETQLLNGDGTGANLSGLIPNATAYTDPLDLGANANEIDMIGGAILQSALAEFPADGVLVHPSDWMRMRLLKDTDGKYLLGDPQTVVTPNLFGLPVVASQAIAVDTFLVGNFQAAATLYDRWAARVEVSTEHADFFTRNLVAILCEERLGLAIKQPGALILGDFGNIT